MLPTAVAKLSNYKRNVIERRKKKKKKQRENDFYRSREIVLKTFAVNIEGMKVDTKGR